MQVFYCDHFELPLPPGHRFPIAKYQLTRERLVRELAAEIQLRVAPAATREQLGRVHEDGYLAKVFSGDLTDLEQRRIGFPWSLKMLERCRRSTGATIETAAAALRDSVAVHLSGGTHHAFADGGQGFCVFNDIAVAIRQLQFARRIRNAVVIDLDVHQGNGTASIFAEDESVFTFSMHGDRNYPFRKMHSDLDIALPDGTGDDDYLRHLAGALQSQLPLAATDIVFYLAGADPYEHDRMGRLKLTKAGLAARDALVFEACANAKLPIAVVLAGGYAAVEDVAEIHCQTVSLAVASFRSQP